MTDNQEPMSVSIRDEGDIVVIAVAGELDLHSSELLVATVSDTLERPRQGIDIDAEGLTFAVYGVADKCAKGGGAFGQRAVSGRQRRRRGAAAAAGSPSR